MSAILLSSEQEATHMFKTIDRQQLVADIAVKNCLRNEAVFLSAA
jgi:hypothetical protein